jgi:hypothetical protein
MARSIEDLLTWGELCSTEYLDTGIHCSRNEHPKETPHRAEDGLEWSS